MEIAQACHAEELCTERCLVKQTMSQMIFSIAIAELGQCVSKHRNSHIEH